MHTKLPYRLERRSTRSSMSAGPIEAANEPRQPTPEHVLLSFELHWSGVAALSVSIRRADSFPCGDIKDDGGWNIATGLVTGSASTANLANHVLQWSRRPDG